MSDGAARARGEEGEGLRVGASLRRRLALRERIVSRRVRRGRDAEFLFRHAGELLADKWLDLKRPVERVVALTPRDGALLQALAEGELCSAWSIDVVRALAAFGDVVGTKRGAACAAGVAFSVARQGFFGGRG